MTEWPIPSNKARVPNLETRNTSPEHRVLKPESRAPSPEHRVVPGNEHRAEY